jgi:hypothetical protein
LARAIIQLSFGYGGVAVVFGRAGDLIILYVAEDGNFIVLLAGRRVSALFFA